MTSERKYTGASGVYPDDPDAQPTSAGLAAADIETMLGFAGVQGLLAAFAAQRLVGRGWGVGRQVRLTHWRPCGWLDPDGLLLPCRRRCCSAWLVWTTTAPGYWTGCPPGVTRAESQTGRRG